MAAAPTALRRPAVWLATTVWATLLLVIGLETAVSGRDVARELVSGFSGYAIIALLAYGALGTGLALRRPRHGLGWLALGIAAGHGIALATGAYSYLAVERGLPGADWAVWAASWTWVPPYLMVPTFLLLLFPDGRLPSRRWRPVGGVAAAGVALATLGWATLPYGQHDKPIGVEATHPIGLPFAETVLNVGSALAVVGALVALAALVVRDRRSGGVERQQVRWVLLGGAATAVLLVSAIAAGPNGGGAAVVAVAMLPLPAAMAVGVLRHRLWDVDVVINRSLVYAVLTIGVLGTYVGTVSLLGGLLGRGTGAPLVATALVAVGINPVRQRVRAWVNEALYGQREDPYTALARLVERLGAADGATSALSGVADTVCRVLRSPYAEVEVGGAPRSVSGEHSADHGELFTIPLSFRGERIGSLQVALPGRVELDPNERQLLDDLARHIAVAAHTEQLTEDLRRSRQQLVEAREEERRRIRRDLHDELGPTLASVAMRVEQVRATSTDPHSATTLAGVPERVREAVATVRSLVAGLRPAALDELGLAEAVREQARRFHGPALHVKVDVAEDLGPMSAAVDVAAYRIVSEALANVVRHSNAKNCRVTVRRADGKLHVEVVDDGRGLPNVPGPGLGLSSMRERAAEVGGTCTITPHPGGGTVVCAQLPVAP